MPRFACYVVAPFVGALFASSVSDAQAADRHRLALSLSAGVSSVPGEFTDNDCFSWVGWGVGGGAIGRFASWLSVEGSAQVLPGVTSFTGCDPVIYTIPAGPNEYDLAGLIRTDTRPRVPLVQTTVRARVHAPRPVSLLRATAGGGVTWGRNGRAFPMITYGIGMSSRGVGRRAFVELERSIARMRSTGTLERFTYAPPATSLGTRQFRVVEHPAWLAVRAGLEVPFGGRRRPPS